MKRTVIVAAGVVALGVMIYVGQLWAQTGSGAPTSMSGAQSKVAVFNLTQVIKNYEKFKAFQEELKTAVAPFQGRDTGYKNEGEKLAKEAQQPTTSAERRDLIEKQLTELKRKIEDNKADANKALVKKQEEQLYILYYDVYNVVQRIAQSRGFDMVLHYNDAVDQKERWTPQNIARKMQAGALMPMIINNATLDISSDVVATLNSSYKAPAANPARPAAPATH